MQKRYSILCISTLIQGNGCVQDWLLHSRGFFFLFNVDVDTVDLYILIGADHNVFHTANDPGFDQVAAGGIYLDDHIRGLDLKMLVVNDVFGMQIRFKAKNLVIIHAELGQPIWS